MQKMSTKQQVVEIHYSYLSKQKYLIPSNLQKAHMQYIYTQMKTNVFVIIFRNFEKGVMDACTTEKG